MSSVLPLVQGVVGFGVGCSVGSAVGFGVGSAVGSAVGSGVGVEMGAAVVGARVGALVSGTSTRGMTPWHSRQTAPGAGADATLQTKKKMKMSGRRRLDFIGVNSESRRNTLVYN